MLTEGLGEPLHQQKVPRTQEDLACAGMALGQSPLEQASCANGERGDADGLEQPLEEVLVVGMPADALVRALVEVDEAGIEGARCGQGLPHHFPEKRIGVCGRVGLMSPVAVSAGARLSDEPEATPAPQVGPVRYREEEIPQRVEELRRNGSREVRQRTAGRKGGVIEQLVRRLAAAASARLPLER